MKCPYCHQEFEIKIVQTPVINWEGLKFKQEDKVRITDKLWNSACPDPDVLTGKIGKVIGYNQDKGWYIVKIDNGGLLWLFEREMEIVDE